MDKLTNYRQIIQNTLTKLDTIANSSSKKKLETCLILDRNRNHLSIIRSRDSQRRYCFSIS